MKTFLCIFINVIFPIWLTAQARDNSDDGNSYKRMLARLNPSLRYSFDRSKYTHDYSGNWDFDGDKKLDSFYFVGDNALHWFHIRIILSSDKKIRDFPWLVTEFPLLQSFDFMKKAIKESLFVAFVVTDFNDDGKMEIYFNLNTSYNPIPLKWRKRGVSSPNILIRYENKDLSIKNFPMEKYLK